MKAAEIDAFEKKYGYKPTEIKVAMMPWRCLRTRQPDQGLSLDQLDSIFSSTNKRGKADQHLG